MCSLVTLNLLIRVQCKCSLASSHVLCWEHQDLRPIPPCTCAVSPHAHLLVPVAACFCVALCASILVKIQARLDFCATSTWSPNRAFEAHRCMLVTGTFVMSPSVLYWKSGSDFVQ